MFNKQAHKNHNPKENKVIVRKEYTKMKNTNKGFTLIELIMVTIILGILAAVAIPRYMASITKAEEAAEDAVISSIRAGLESYATEKMMDNGRRSWPNNPWDALETKPAGYAATGSGSGQDADGIADSDGEWTWSGGSQSNITHMRNNGVVVHWDYRATISPGTNNGSNTDAIGDLSARGVGADGNAVGGDHAHN